MAQHKQAAKRHRQSLVRRNRNQHFTSMMRTYVKRARTAIDENPAEAGELVKKAVSIVDSVAQKGIIPHSRASRTVGRLMRAHQKALADKQ
jgi:small subunit ribosomal protein S20